MTEQNISLTPQNSIRTCIRNNKMCYYELDKIIKANKMIDEQLSSSFKADNNSGYSFKIFTNGDPILIQKGIQIDVKLIDNKVNYQFMLLK